MSKSEIDQTITSLWNSITKPNNLVLDEKYFTEEPVMCEIGNFGFGTKALAAILVVAGDGAGYSNGYRYQAPGAGQLQEDYYGGNRHFFAIIYFDDVSFWKSGKNKISLNGIWVEQDAHPYVGFVEYPPEEWDVTARSGISFDTIRQKALAAQHAKYLDTWGTSYDISDIYEGDKAKTLVMFRIIDGNGFSRFSNISITVNGELLNWSMYKLILFAWSDRIANSNGNQIAKTLTKKIAVTDETTVYNILDAFPGYTQISNETAYAAMSDAAINQRANALMEYIAAQDGQTKYRKNNEVIE
jgi:hypothetical protein